MYSEQAIPDKSLDRWRKWFFDSLGPSELPIICRMQGICPSGFRTPDKVPFPMLKRFFLKKVDSYYKDSEAVIHYLRTGYPDLEGKIDALPQPCTVDDALSIDSSMELLDLALAMLASRREDVHNCAEQLMTDYPPFQISEEKESTTHTTNPAEKENRRLKRLLDNMKKSAAKKEEKLQREIAKLRTQLTAATQSLQQEQKQRKKTEADLLKQIRQEQTLRKESGRKLSVYEATNQRLQEQIRRLEKQHVQSEQTQQQMQDRIRELSCEIDRLTAFAQGRQPIQKTIPVDPSVSSSLLGRSLDPSDTIGADAAEAARLPYTGESCTSDPTGFSDSEQQSALSDSSSAFVQNGSAGPAVESGSGQSPSLEQTVPSDRSRTEVRLVSSDRSHLPDYPDTVRGILQIPIRSRFGFISTEQGLDLFVSEKIIYNIDAEDGDELEGVLVGEYAPGLPQYRYKVLEKGKEPTNHRELLGIIEERSGWIGARDLYDPDLFVPLHAYEVPNVTIGDVVTLLFDVSHPHNNRIVTIHEHLSPGDSTPDTERWVRRKSSRSLSSNRHTDGSGSQSQLQEQEKTLQGVHVLICGAQSNMVSQYEQAIRARGGSVVVLESQPTSMEPYVSKADVIICNTHQMNHPFYWVLKEETSRQNKTMRYPISGGVSSMLREVEEFLARE